MPVCLLTQSMDGAAPRWKGQSRSEQLSGAHLAERCQLVGINVGQQLHGRILHTVSYRAVHLRDAGTLGTTTYQRHHGRVCMLSTCALHLMLPGLPS